MYSELRGRKYKQIQSLRDLTRTNFPNGQIRFNWSVPAQESWNPAFSFFTLRHDFNGYTKINRVGNANVTAQVPSHRLARIDGIAPVMFINDSLWQQMEMRINGITINKQDTYAHQIAALKHRMCPEPKNKTMNELNFHSPYFIDRLNQVTSDGKYKQRPQLYEYDLIELIDQVGLDIAANVSILAVILAGDEGDITFVAGNDPKALGIKPGDVIMYKLAGLAVPVVATRMEVIEIDGFVVTVRVDTDVAIRAAAPVAADEFTLISDTLPKFVEKEIPRKSIFETIWKPKLGFWSIDDWLPGGEYEIVLTPYPSSTYKISAIQSNKDESLISSVQYEILNMQLNICTSKQPSTLKGISFYETRCQAKTLNTASLSQKQFTVNPKTEALTLAYQDQRVQSSYNIPGGVFKIAEGDKQYNDYEMFLSRFYIQYDGEVLPNPIPNIRNNKKNNELITEDEQNEDLISQRYWETQFNKVMIYDDIESMEEWKERGPYYHFHWPRQNAGASQVQVSTEFSKALPIINNVGLRPQVLLFEHYPCKYSFDLHMNYITDVKKTL